MADGDGDGIGEYGSFLELSSAALVRGRGEPLSPPVLPAAFREVSLKGIVRRGGYNFRMLLPGRAGRPTWDTGPPWGADPPLRSDLRPRSSESEFP
jgi:hypothetical protein